MNGEPDNQLETRALAALEKAVEWLMTKQSAEGAFPSETYGALRQGAATTSLVLYALAHVPKELRARHARRLAEAYSFLRIGIDKKGFVVNTDGSPDYPEYGSAMALVAAERLRLAMTDDERDALRAFLLQAQLDERRKFDAASPHHGGWDLMGASRLEGITSGTNVSVGVFALEALALDDSPEAQAARTKALRWTAGCQAVSYDGGFPFTPEAGSDSNKAKTDKDRDERPRPYGTTTCDGLRCLIYAGVKADDKRVTAAAEWLARHDKLETVPGFEDLDESVGWQKGLKLYYYFSLAKCLPYLPEETATARRSALLGHVLSLQETDGRWQNESARMREDDPLIATALIAAALGELLSAS
jgi:squalene-hopene/tetraprenyl-beta-curcumene cyclase